MGNHEGWREYPHAVSELVQEEYSARRVHDLSGRDRQIVNLLVSRRSVREVAACLEMEHNQVRREVTRIKRSLGVRTIIDLTRIVMLSQIRWEPTPAMSLYVWAQKHLVGAIIRGAVVHDSDWFGLLLDFPNGEARTAWFVHNLEGDSTSGWIEIE